jgi:hypothetical protein
MPATLSREYVSNFLPNYTAHIPEDCDINIYRREKLKPKPEEIVGGRSGYKVIEFHDTLMMIMKNLPSPRRTVLHMHGTLLQGQAMQVICRSKATYMADVIFPYPASHLITSSDRFMGPVRPDRTSAASVRPLKPTAGRV